MSKRYTGNFISGTPQVPSLTSNNGIFDIKDVYAATSNNQWQEPDGYYEIPKSLRFRGSMYLSRALSSAGNQQTWTYSFWFKRGNLSNTVQRFIYAGNGSNNEQTVYLSSDRLVFEYYVAPTNYYTTATARLRDPSAWYHAVMVWDTTNSVASNRIRTYINGVQQTAFDASNYPSQNLTGNINGTSYSTRIGVREGGTDYFDGHLAEVNFVDGQALDPSYFGYFDPITNIWQPKTYTGGYGSKGFYLPFNEPAATSGTVNAYNVGRNFAGGTNYIRYSQDGSQTSYGYVYERASNSINNTTAPDGSTTANKLTSDGTASNTHRFYCGTAATPTGSTQTTSIYLKYHSCRYINIENWNGSTYQTQTFDVLNGCAAASGVGIAATGFTSQHVGNGWYRVSVPLYAGSNNISSPSIAIYLCDSSGNNVWNGDGTSAVYWWGSQLNLGTTADPYFKTASSTTITNDWAPTNFSVTAGATYDIMVDSPTNIVTNVTDTGGVISGNYPTWNPLIAANYNNSPSLGSTLVSYSNANLTDYVSAATGNAPRMQTISTMGFPNSGKWYWEAVASTTNTNFGICKGQLIVTNGSGSGMDATVVYGVGGGFGLGSNVTGTTSGTALSATTSDVIGIAFDVDNMTISWYKNNTYMCSVSNIVYTGTANVSSPWFAHRGLDTSSQAGGSTVNFGQRPFTYAPPAGYKSLNTTNIQALGTAAVGKAAIASQKWFDIVLSGGNTTGRTVSGLQFQPDLVMFKNRDGAANRRWSWFDSVRGPNASITSQSTDTEVTSQTDLLTSFTSDGFTVGADAGLYGTNGYNERWAQWCWKQSPTSGFNIVSYTGNGANNRAISHNLGTTPAFIMVKGRDIAYNWDIYHQALGVGATMIFTTTSTRNYSAFGTTSPTSSNFYTQDQFTNTNGYKYIAYVFAEVPGFSKFGTYMGNGSSDGPIINCGFRPKWVMVHCTSASTSDWPIYDTARSPQYNPDRQVVYADLNNAEATAALSFDFLSNGFKFREGGGQGNDSGQTYVYAAFAESPFALNNRAK